MLLELISLIYDAALDETHWQDFLAAFVHATHSARGTLLLVGSGLESWRATCWHGWTENEIRLHKERYSPIDPWTKHTLGEGDIRFSTELCSQEEFEQSIAYKEFYGPLNISCGFGGIILVTDIGASAITVCRSKQQGFYDEADKALLATLLPHLKRAALIHGQLVNLRKQLGTFTSHLDRYPYCLILTNADAKMIYANKVARETLSQQDGVRLRNGRVVLQSRVNDEFSKAIMRTAADRVASTYHFDVSRPSGREPYRALVMSIPQFGGAVLDASQPGAAIVIVDSERMAPLDSDIIGKLFSLTQAESQVAAELAMGRCVDEISRHHDVSIQTVRSQVKSILSKTNTTRQGELISLVLRAAPFRRL